MFGKKKNATPSVPDAAPQAKTGKKPKKNILSEILHESVVETVMDKFRSNDAFIMRKDGEDAYVGLLLRLSDIGGIDKKSRRDEAKGTLIERINSGQIATLVTQQLLDEESIIIVPEPITLSQVEEFSMLMNTQYELVYVDEATGDYEPTGVKITVADAQDVIANEGSVEEFLEGDEPEDDPVLDEIADETDEGDIPEDDDDAIPDYGEEDEPIPDIEDEPADDEPMPDYGADQPMYEQPAMQEAPMPEQTPQGMPEQGYGGYQEQPAADYGQSAAYEAAMQEEPVPEQEDDVPMEWVGDAVTRRFYSDDLGLEISSAPFDAQFMEMSTYVPFATDRPSGWLNDQLNEMAQAANEEMERLHMNNLFVMRERYFKLISMHCDQIVRDLDVNSVSTPYGQEMNQLLDKRGDEEQTLDARINRRKSEMERQWNQKLQEVGQDAARAAQAQYKERYGKQHERDIYDIESAIKASIKDDFEDAVHEMHNRRRQEAGKLLEMGIGEVLDEVSEMYLSALEEEKIRYQELQENMRMFLDDNRKYDIQRTDTYQEELRQSQKADQVLAEQTQKIQTLTAEYNQKRKELQDQISDIREENKRSIAKIKEQHEAELARVEEERDKAQASVTGMLDRVDAARKDEAQKYERRINEMANEIEGWEANSEHMVSLHKRSSVMYIFVTIAAIVLALAIGFIGGEYININRQTNQQTQRIMSEYQMDQAPSASDSATGVPTEPQS